MPMTVPIHKFSVHRRPPMDLQTRSAEQELKHQTGWEDELASRLQELSHEAKLGPVIVLNAGATVIVGELTGFIQIEVDVPQIAVPGQMLPPGAARRR